MTINIGGVKIPELTYPVLTSSSTYYINVDFFEEYVDVLGLDSSFPAAGVNDTEKQAAVYRGQIYIESLRYQGAKEEPYVQNLQWPRYGVEDRNGVAISTGQTPYDIFNASAEAALLEFNSVGVLQPQVNPANLAPVSGEKVQAGSVGVETTYDTSKISDVVQHKIGADLYTRLKSFLNPWLSGSNKTFYSIART